MLTDIGVIIGVYAFLRLGLSLDLGFMRNAEGRRPAWIAGVVILGMAVIALLTVDILSIGSGWLEEEVGGLQ